MKFPLGINTPMNRGDASLSRGELLLLMLARVIIAQPNLLVLDETLDGVDPDSLEIVYGILLDPKAPWTLVDFTHDTLVWEKFCYHYMLTNGTLVNQVDSK
jgi:ABC-type Mn2+/Zn2+ transport system ATPase subunit